MAWSAKLISGDGGVSGYNEWQLVFDPATQTAYKATYNISIGNEAPDVLYHTPDNGSPVPIRATGNNRIIFLEMHIPAQTSWNNVLNKIAPIARLVDGADSQAMRSQVGNGERVRVAIKPDGASYTTYFDVLHGFVDTSRSFTQDVSIVNVAAYRVTIALTCKPFGHGASFVLENSLASSPHFLQDSNADGLADGWAKTGTSTCTISTNRYLIGNQTQKFTTDTSSAHGIQSAVVTASAGSTIYAKVAVTTDLKDKISIVLRNGAGTAITVKDLTGADTGNIADASVIGPDGATWYIISVTGENTGVADCYLQIQRSATNATQATQCWVDAAYLSVGVRDAPPPTAWHSSRDLKNRYDPASTSAATQQQINYNDVWGIPGDVPALIEQNIQMSTSTVGQGLIVGKIDQQQAILAAVGSYRTTYDSAAMTAGASWTTTSSSSVSIGGSYLNTPNPPSGTGGVKLDTNTIKYLKDMVGRVYLMCRKSHSSGTITVKAIYGANVVTIGTASPAAINTWSLVDVGALNITGTSKDFDDVEITFLASGSSGTVLIDAMLILPTHEFMIANYTIESALFGQYVIIDGVEEHVWGSWLSADGVVSIPVGYTNVQPLGSMWKATPGPVTTRYVYVRAGTKATPTPEPYAIADTISLSLTVTPRTSHLLGTL